LFGLSAIAIETRKKEIGIRKVVGASSADLIRLLSTNSLVMVLVGSAIAMPLAWYAMDWWLARFAFKISVTADVFVITLVLALVVAFASVLLNALKAAMANPVKALRNE
jgi:putative ABC transport system permease protein